MFKKKIKKKFFLFFIGLQQRGFFFFVIKQFCFPVVVDGGGFHKNWDLGSQEI